MCRTWHGTQPPSAELKYSDRGQSKEHRVHKPKARKIGRHHPAPCGKVAPQTSTRGPPTAVAKETWSTAKSIGKKEKYAARTKLPPTVCDGRPPARGNDIRKQIQRMSVSWTSCRGTQCQAGGQRFPCALGLPPTEGHHDHIRRERHHPDDVRWPLTANSATKADTPCAYFATMKTDTGVVARLGLGRYP